MTCRVLRRCPVPSLCSLAGFPWLLLGQRSLTSRQFGHLVFPPPGYRAPSAEQLRRTPLYTPPALRLYSLATPYLRPFDPRITRRGAPLPPLPAALHRFPARLLSLSACTMAASGKIDLNSPSISWKEAKNYLKGLKEKQRREHYAVKDFIKLKEIPTWKDTAKKTNAKQPEEVKFPKNKDLNEKISLFRGDITKLELDAIVNAANSTLLGGGGVDGCIHRTAGPLLKLECSSLGGCETGQAKITCGYLLPAKCVIHTVGPVAQGPPGTTQEQELINCYNNCMYLASESKLRTLAFPCISTGVFGYPAEDAADVALGTIRKYLEEHKDKFDRIIICVFLEKDEEIYRKKLPEYFPLV